MTENKEQKREDMIGGDEIAVVPANEEIADTLLPKKEEEDELIVKFRKPYKFEDDTFTELDLHGLEDLTGRTLTAIEKAFNKTGVSSFVPESTTTYAKIVATKVTGLPAEFFEDLPGRRDPEDQKRRCGFFVQRRVRHDSGADIQKTAVHLAMATNTGIDFFTDLPLDEYIDIAKEVSEIGKENKLRTGA